ncbi:ANKRD50 [Symbiodinium sp. CCMP2592]|nr:ANKRD50 [Symbiodinium sp. CCMP2592]
MLRIMLVSGKEVTSIPLTELSDVKALKQRLHQQQGLPPRFRQRLVHGGSTLGDEIKFDSVLDPDGVAATSSEATDKMQRQVTAAADHGSPRTATLKRRLDPEDGAPPPCKQRRLHELKASIDGVDVVIDLQVLILPFSEASDSQRRELCRAAHHGRLHKAGARDFPDRNCKEDELDFYAAALYQLIEGVKKDQPVEFKKFDDELAILQEKLSDVVTEKMVKMVSQDDMGGDDDTPLPACPADFGIEAGDFLTFSYGGPNFEEAGGIMKEIAFEDEAMQLRIHYSYGPYFDYSQTFNTTSDVEYKNRTLGSKVGRFFELSWKHTLNAIVRAGKAVGDLTANGGKLLWDMTVNAGKVLGKMAMWTGAGVAKVYSRVRQTTPHTNQTKWTHTEMGIGGGRTISAYGRGVYSNGFPVCKNPGEIVISRFVGDGTVNAAAYRKLAAERALMWEPYLGHYADTVGQWHRAVFGHCMSWLGTPGKSEYFEAVTPERVEEMWNYTPSEQDTERGFFDGMRDNFRTHASTNHSNHTRIKPKAMFCSKLVAAVWSSTIGNPTASPDAQPRSEDLKKMFPFNPGACSPWTLVQWLLSKKGRETWHSCIAEPGRNFHACGWYR